MCELKSNGKSFYWSKLIYKTNYKNVCDHSQIQFKSS